MKASEIDKMVDAHVDYVKRRSVALYGHHQQDPVQTTEAVSSLALLEEIAKAVGVTPTNRPVLTNGPDALCVEYRNCTFWTPLSNRRMEV